ncbi:beta-ketoacyl synthase N-terminal-like domain-containing protein [Streptomyces sp. NPDC059083]|uniref:beta-ketoacyl synthase N-terminal-like domain-containing protein n=1 Tax=unclassified Streptomyces TaxID=2593676 RepID=UPI0036B3C50A
MTTRTAVTTRTHEPRITDISVLSVAGLGLETVRARLGASPSEDLPLNEPPRADAADYVGIPGSVSAVPSFDITDFVPKKGTKNIDRTTALGLAASARLKRTLTESAGITDDSWLSTGVAMGSMVGSLRSSIELDSRVIEGAGIDLINPAQFPNTTMNCCAAQVAIWHRFRGPNSTLANGSLSAVSALQYASRLIDRGHGQRMLVGGVEELSPHTAWGIRSKKIVHDTVPVAEAAAVFALEPDGLSDAPALATVAACAVGFAPVRTDAGYAEALRRVTAGVLRRAGVDDTAVGLVLPGAEGTVLAEAEQAALAGFAAPRVDVRAAFGECGSALGALQVAAALAAGRPGDTALITGIDISGAVGAAVLRIGAAA